MNFFNPLKNQPDEKTEPISRQVWTCNHVIHIGHYEITIKDHKIPSLTILTFDSPLVHPLDNKPSRPAFQLPRTCGAGKILVATGPDPTVVLQVSEHS